MHNLFLCGQIFPEEIYKTSLSAFHAIYKSHTTTQKNIYSFLADGYRSHIKLGWLQKRLRYRCTPNGRQTNTHRQGKNVTTLLLSEDNRYVFFSVKYIGYESVIFRVLFRMCQASASEVGGGFMTPDHLPLNATVGNNMSAAFGTERSHQQG